MLEKITIEQVKNIINNTEYQISRLSNVSALLNEALDNINWVGFYLYQDNKLILGPFQGKVACTVIPLNKGVCGAAATSRKTLVVDNVHEFKGHIACDSASNSEIVVPLVRDDELLGVLDIDSPLFNRFTNNEKAILEEIGKLISNNW